MLFQVINNEGVPVMRTEQKICIPDDNLLLSMFKAGYKFKVDGRLTPIKRIKEIRDDS